MALHLKHSLARPCRRSRASDQRAWDDRRGRSFGAKVMQPKVDRYDSSTLNSGCAIDDTGIIVAMQR